MNDKQKDNEAQKDKEAPAQESDSSSKDKLPGAPARDDPTPLGDTDQHSDA
jgi:hypothetical protein